MTPRPQAVSFDGSLGSIAAACWLLVTLGVATLTGILFGLAPVGDVLHGGEQVKNAAVRIAQGPDVDLGVHHVAVLAHEAVDARCIGQRAPPFEGQRKHAPGRARYGDLLRELSPLYEMARAAGKEDQIGHLNPMKRGGEPDEIANAALFLMSDEASFITGANLMVDGGFTAGKS